LVSHHANLKGVGVIRRRRQKTLSTLLQKNMISIQSKHDINAANGIGAGYELKQLIEFASGKPSCNRLNEKSDMNR